MVGRECKRMDVRSDLGSLEKLVHLLVCHLLPQLCEDISQLACADEAVALLVKDLEATDELLCPCAMMSAMPTTRLAGRERREGVMVTRLRRISETNLVCLQA